MDTHVNWAVPVALDLFLAAMGAGAFMLAVMADLAGGRRYRRISTAGALLAPGLAIIGLVLLIVDLGVPWRFWEMILKRGETGGLESPYLMFKFSSSMSIGTWIMTFFIILALIYIVATILAWPFRWGGTVKKIVGILGLPFALLVTIYTGVLLSATTNPLWNTPWLPPVFVASGLTTGAALLIFVLALLQIRRGLGVVEDEQIPRLEKLNSRIMIFQLVALVLFIVFGITSKAMISVIGLGYGVLWWVCVVGLGLIVPLVFGFRGKPRLAGCSLVSSGLVLVGGFLLRYVILFAGQA